METRTAGFVPPTAICRHSSGDPSCSKNGGGAYSYQAASPDSSNFEIEEAEQVGRHLVLRVKYPNCSSCAYEGSKVMVFLNTSPLQAMRWKKIDPHFRAPRSVQPGFHANENPREAPSPAARFPASREGWSDALSYARTRDT